jgi:predicted transcriptional regulator
MHIQSQLEQLESIRRGIAEIEAGHYIPREATKTWLLSLDFKSMEEFKKW